MSPHEQVQFIGEHSSWDRRPHSGYKVVFVLLADRQPQGTPIDVLTGFPSDDGKAHGRPVGVTLDKTGASSVGDDVGHTVRRVSARQ